MIGRVTIKYEDSEKGTVTLGASSVSKDATIADVLQAIVDSLRARYQKIPDGMLDGGCPKISLEDFNDPEKLRQHKIASDKFWEERRAWLDRLPWFIPNPKTDEDLAHNFEAEMQQLVMEREAQEIVGKRQKIG